MVTIFAHLRKQLTLLSSLTERLKEEYILLQKQIHTIIPSMTFAMQDIIREIDDERRMLRHSITVPLKDYIRTLPNNQQKTAFSLIEEIQHAELLCKEQMKKNKLLTEGLLEQCRQNIRFIQKSFFNTTPTEYLPSGEIKISAQQGNFLYGSL